MKTILAASTALATLLVSACATSSVPEVRGAENPREAAPDAESVLFDYLRKQNTTGFIVTQDGEVLIEQNWPAPKTPNFRMFSYGQATDGSLYEDVASQQKSFIAVLVGIAIDKGLIDVEQPVSSYLKAGWSEASVEQEAAIKVVHILEMNSGLGDDFYYEAEAGTKFLYNTPVYAILKDILTAVSGLSLEDLTRVWLTEPAGMTDTEWRQRPAALANIGNPTGLVTTPADTAKFGTMILQNGISASGTRVISEESLADLFEPSTPNPAYGRLWWLNGSAYIISPQGRKDGQLIAEAPADLVAAFGFLDRRLYVVPSLNVVIARTGADAPDKNFDNELWKRLNPVFAK